MSKSFRMFYTWDPSDPPRYHHKAIDREYFEWLFSMLEGTGLTFLYRCNLAGRTYYPSRLMASFDHGCVDYRNPDASFWHRVAEAVEGGDPLAEAVAAARRHGVPIWAWWNWNEFQNVREGWLSVIDPVWYDRPRKFWCSRDGSRFYHGIPDFGDSEVQQRLLGLASETSAYGVDGMYLSTRSHSWFACWNSPGWADHLEPFGFNDSVVEAYRKRYGVDIRYKDYDEEAWLRIKGEQFSSVLSRTGEMMHRRGQPFIVGVSPNRYELCVDFESKGYSGDRQPGGRYLRLYKDWEGWAAGGSIDGICAEESCPHEAQLETGNIAPFRETLPDGFPLYTWADTAHYCNRGAGPFSLVNWNRNSVEEVIQQISNARNSHAAGIFLHTMYHFTAIDSGGESIGGYGVLPRTEYFDALRELQQSSA